MHHIDGREENIEPGNTAWACRRCNTTIGVVMKRAGLGRRTIQFNPAAQGASSVGQWLTAVMSMKGESDAMSVPAAVEMIRATPPERRSEYARAIWQLRRERWGPSGRSDAPPF